MTKMTKCITPNCTNEVKTNFQLARTAKRVICNKCAKLLLTNGAPDQKAILKRQLDPYVEQLEKLMDQTGKREAVKKYLDEQWNSLIALATETLERETKTPTNKWMKEACREILDMAAQTDGETVGLYCMAHFMLREDQPRAYSNDQAFEYQLGRTARILAPHRYVASYWDHVAQKQVKLYHRMTGRTRQTVGQMLKQSFSAVAGQAIGIIRAKEKAREDSLTAAKSALREMAQFVYQDELERQLSIHRA